ncbi:hypothetical protein [Flavobacterium olei]|mgnify:CR=1 FL=1|uniref:hypothetical protein n=1 Tax=Flavobacterium olei TaxID=1886782 RepID=UPI00321AB6C4
MKNLRALTLAVILIFFAVSFAIAGSQNPPPPTLTATSTTSTLDEVRDCDPICPPDFPINNNIIFLAIGGLALGATVIYKNHIKKASV